MLRACTRVRNGEEKAIVEARRREREGKSRGQSADHVGAVPVIPRVAARQITHLARVNNYSETHIIVLHYAYISHACASAGRAFKVLSCGFATSRSSNASASFASRSGKLLLEPRSCRNRTVVRATELILRNERSESVGQAIMTLRSFQRYN